jgi:AraC family transcriptional regulator
MNNPLYTQRINRVIDHIHTNLNSKFTLNKLAEIAMFSSYHFHRIFKTVTGETLNGFIKRIRMEMAMKKLHSNPELSILDIAIEVGYQSAANFSRDFKEYFNLNPTTVRNSKPSPMRQKLIQTPEIDIEFTGIHRLKDLFIIYKRVLTGYNPNEIAPAFSELITYAANHNLNSYVKSLIGIGYDDPDYTPADKCRYDACLLVEENMKLPDQFPYNYKKLPPGRYAKFSFTGKKEQFIQAWDVIFKEWLIQSDYIPDNKPHLEIYKNREEKNEYIYHADLYLPIITSKNHKK